MLILRSLQAGAVLRLSISGFSWSYFFFGDELPESLDL